MYHVCVWVWAEMGVGVHLLTGRLRVSWLVDRGCIDGLIWSPRRRVARAPVTMTSGGGSRIDRSLASHWLAMMRVVFCLCRILEASPATMRRLQPPEGHSVRRPGTRYHTSGTHVCTYVWVPGCKESEKPVSIRGHAYLAAQSRSAVEGPDFIDSTERT